MFIFNKWLSILIMSISFISLGSRAMESSSRDVDMSSCDGMEDEIEKKSFKTYIEKWLPDGWINQAGLYVPLEGLSNLKICTLKVGSNGGAVELTKINKAVFEIMGDRDVAYHLKKVHGDSSFLKTELIACAIREFIREALQQKNSRLKEHEANLENLLWSRLDRKAIATIYLLIYPNKKENTVYAEISNVYGNAPEVKAYRAQFRKRK